MRFKIQRWRFSYLLLFLWLPGILALEVTSVTAIEIFNTAVFGGDNVEGVNSNTAFFTAEIAALQIIKTANKTAAEPGDTVIYRVSIRNNGLRPANNVMLRDTLPLGLVLETRSLPASLTANNTTTAVTVSSSQDSNRNIIFNSSASIPPQGILNIAYAVTLTPDALRGSGKNLAVANAGNIKSNTATHQLKIRPGIVSDCGTLIGRVFVDKNFDGEQQPGEAGIPNAVIYMDDGNRIITDANGMYSLANVIAGNRTGTLDLTSLPGYSLAPNLYKIQQNSHSRLVRLAPRSMVRMNFAVTPAFGGGRE
jgi:uncharacterized repeat protein (TIGR01451 family)